MFKKISVVWIKNPTPTPSDLRNPTPTRNLQFLATPTPQPWVGK